MTVPYDNDPWLARLSEYLDGDLAPDEARALEDHLNHCARCSATLDELRVVVSRLRAGSPSDLRLPAPLDAAWPRIASHLSADRPRYPDAYAAPGSGWPVRLMAAGLLLAAGFGGGMWVGAAGCEGRAGWGVPGWMRVGVAADSARPVRVAPAALDSVLDSTTSADRGAGPVPSARQRRVPDTR